MTCGPKLAWKSPSVLRARPPSTACASSRRTWSAPRSAHSIAATSPPSPPPTMVIVVIAKGGREPSEGSMPPSDMEALVRAAQRGDRLALNRLLRELAPVVGPICGAIALDQGDDAMQE